MIRFAQRLRLAVFVVASLGFLAACDSSEERAEGHFQRGSELIASGDVARGLVELRNVFNLNGSHQEARALYARTVRGEGNLQEAFGQYLRLVEQYPLNFEGRLALAQMSIASQDWEEAERHGEVAVELASGNDPEANVVALALAYREAVQNGDPSARREILSEALALDEVLPGNAILRNIILSALVEDGEFEAALGVVDGALATTPDDLALQRSRLSLLNTLDRQDEVEAQLRDMITRFPEDEEIKAVLVRYYVSRERVEDAEAFLRSLIPDGEVDNAARSTLVLFIQQARGSEAAVEELDRLIEEGTNPDLFRSMRATIRFQIGDQDNAIAELEEIVAQPTVQGEQLDRIRVMLARIFVAAGNDVRARALIEEVLERDTGNVSALKMRANWLIAADQSDQAISILRRALDSAPDDAEAITLMARAHIRNGDRDLGGELLARAVEASNSGIEESLRLSRFLSADGSFLPAETILIDALRLAPNQPELLTELGSVYLALQDWSRASQVEIALRDIDTPETLAAANRLQLEVLTRQARSDEALTFLETLSSTGQVSAEAARVAIVRTLLQQGEIEEAARTVSEALVTTPQDRTLRFLQYAILAAQGDPVGSREGFRALLSEESGDAVVWLELIRSHLRGGETEAAREALGGALAAIPANRDLRWMQASFLEQDGNLNGAIDIYEELYNENTSTAIVANNLASLISTTRTDPESIERAYAIARRLRGSEIPAFQDTYGWIAYLRGDFNDAVEHLEPAAAALSDDPRVQYHLGMAYAAVQRPADARRQFEIALGIVGNGPSELRDLVTAAVETLPAP